MHGSPRASCSAFWCRRTAPGAGSQTWARCRGHACPRPRSITPSARESYRRHLADERARAAAAGKSSPATIALLTGAELAAIKPLLVVRSRASARDALLLWGASYVAAFHGVAFPEAPGNRR
jgi:hypothetical protein